MSRTSVGLEVASVTLQPEHRELLAEIFRELDEQSIAPPIRARLAQNGLRAGLIGARIPESIHFLLMEATDRRRHPTAENQSYADELRFVQCRDNKFVTTDIWDVRDMKFALRTHDVEVSEEYQHAQCHMRFAASPQAGGVEIRILPALASGPMRQRYVVQDNAFHLEAARDVRTFDELAIDISLHPGDVFLMTSNQWPDDSLGRAFFENADRRKILLIRLAQTQIDDLFSENE